MTDCSKHYMEEDDACPYCEIDKLNLQVYEFKSRICAGICGADFPGFAAGEHMPRCPFRTPCQRAHAPVSMPALYEDGIRSIQCGNCDIQVPLIPPMTEKRDESSPTWKSNCKCTGSFTRNGVCTRCGWPV